MIPIYEQGGGRGIGHDLDSFVKRFEEICREHTAAKRAKAFAFIFYDFGDTAIQKILKDHGAFVRLDRLSGNDLSVFHLHKGGRESIARFNREFISKLGLDGDVKPPCVVFFKMSDEGLTDVSVAALDSTDLIHGLDELYRIIEDYIEKSDRAPAAAAGSKSIRWIKSAAKFVSIEVVRGAIRAGLGF